MGKRLLKSLTNNFGFKLLAVFFAFMLWLVVYNIEDPTVTKTYTASVMIKNPEVITEMNKYYTVIDNSSNVTFAVSAKRSIFEKLEDSDFTAVADMNNLLLDGDGKMGTVRIDISSSRYANSLKYNGKTQYLTVALEDLMSKQFVVSADVQGKVANGYALGAVQVTNPNVLKVSGPESIVGKITNVVATIDVEGMSVNLSDKVVPVLYDEDGNEIATTQLKLSNETVLISAQILGTKEVPLEFSTQGVPAGGNTVLEIVSNPSKIRLKGTASALNQITSVEIPKSLLNVAGITHNLSTTIDITEYLPDNVELVDMSDANVFVTVKIESDHSRNFTIPTSKFYIEGLKEGYEVHFTSTTVTVIVNGAEEDLARITSADVSGTVDVTGLTEGSHIVSVKISLDDETYSWKDIKVTLVIEKKASDAQSANPEDNSNTQKNEDDSENEEDEENNSHSVSGNGTDSENPSPDDTDDASDAEDFPTGSDSVEPAPDGADDEEDDSGKI